MKKNALCGAKWVWCDSAALKGINNYAEFTDKFASAGGRTTLEISAPTNYAVWINGKFVANGQYGDYPNYKVYDRIDVTRFVKAGENLLCILAYDQGNDSYAYYYKTPAIIYAVKEDGKATAISGANTLARPSLCYYSGEVERLAPPLGYVLRCDLSKDDGWKEGKGKGFAPAAEVDTGFTLYPRKIARPEILPEEPSRIAACGVFKENGGGTVGEIAERAFLSARTLVKMTGISREVKDRLDTGYDFSADGECDGIYVVVDMDTERVGYLTFDIETDGECKAVVAMGEHLADLRVRAFVGERNFAQTFTLKKGKNDFTEYMRRIAGRYLMLFVYADKAKISRLNVLDYMYPFKEKKTVFPDGLKQRIYDVGVRTLKVCFHEHYEDCPGREQTLYGQDSRNQMLYSYGVFEGTAPQADSLRLLALTALNHPDGLVKSTAPGYRLGILPELKGDGIPNFALFWALAVCEYYERTKDKKLLSDVLFAVRSSMKAFENRIVEKGIESFPNGKYFNFYEWSEGMEPGTNANTDAMSALKDKKPTVDFILTAFFAFVARSLSEILSDAGLKDDAAQYKKLSAEVYKKTENFFDGTDGFYFSYIDDGGKPFGKHECTQAFALFCECGKSENRRRIAKRIMNGANGLVRCTLPMYQMKYEGVIKSLKKEGIRLVLDDIEKVWGKMLFEGAVTFPEMEGGEKIFEDAASLCHGWSSVPCYFYNKYLVGKSDA